MKFATVASTSTVALSLASVAIAAPITHSTELQDSKSILDSFVETVSALVTGGSPDDSEDPSDHWKKIGKDQKKHWKKIGKGYKKKYSPPADSDDEDVELMEVSDDEGDVEDPADYWKRFGKGQKKHWKKIGKGYKKKYSPPADSDDEDVELMEVSDDEGDVEDPADYWKRFGKGQKKHWKKIGKGYKKKYSPPADSDAMNALI
ncbi:hypothetical protein DAMA08_037940 [Martiniozyma asiatica (nom. inval.)]|nr:hypothetical protein DAMA08_037940 [Martiniozyma asiatica]